MKQRIRAAVVSITLIGVGAGTAYTTRAYAQGGRGKEAHPVIQNSIRQIEGVKDRLQKAPWDFGGHKVAAIEALDRALGELHQAEQADRK